MSEALLAGLIGYLLGSLSGSLLLGRWYGVDVRQHGSGNAGGTNALRVLGPRVALLVVLIDVGKGGLAVLLAWLLFPITPDWPGAAAGLAAVLGHCYPLWHGFRGGKGVASAAGASMLLLPWWVPGLAALWLLTLLASGFASLASLLAALALCLLAFFPFAELPVRLFAILAGAVVILRHESNIERLIQGRESRFERVWLLRRWLTRKTP